MNLSRSQYLLLFFLSLATIIIYLTWYDVKNIQERYNFIYRKLVSFDDQVFNIFIDLGANKGDSVLNFIGMNLNAQGGNLNANGLFSKKLKNSNWIIYAFEANPYFDEQLLNMKKLVTNSKYNHTVYLYSQTAAWIYDGKIDFFLDTVNPQMDFWGSSLNKNAVVFFLNYFYIIFLF